MNIQEQLTKINKTFEKLHGDFKRLEAEKSAIDARCASEVDKARARIQRSRDTLTQQREDVLKYYRIAKDNSDKDLVRSGIRGQKPDIALLNSMIEQVNDSNYHDPTAGRIIDLASTYDVYLDDELRKLGEEERRETDRIKVDKNREKEMIEQKKRQIISDCARYLKGNDIVNLARLFERIQGEYEIDQNFFDEWGVRPKKKKMMLFGYRQYPVDVPQKLSPTLKESLGKHFDEKSRRVNCPCGFTTTSSEDLRVEYTELNEREVKSGVQALILNYLRYFRPAECKVSIFDHIHFNADVLGPLSAISGIRNGVIEDIPVDSDSIRRFSAGLADYYRKVESKIGASSVFEYNSKQKLGSRIPSRILIINRNEEVFSQPDQPEMSYVLNNAAKFGIIVIRLTKSAKGSKGTSKEEKLLSKSKDLVRIISDSQGCFFIEDDIAWMPFRWIEAPDSIPEAFVNAIVQEMKPPSLGNKYFKRYKMHPPKKSLGARRSISTPFAIDDDDNVIECKFENETFAAYIMGAAGSGKSTLLHTIISGLLMNYHPDEVELWLMDFKMLEFKRYVDHKPPHIKYLLLEKSEDLVFDIVDRLTEEMNKREYLFSQHGWHKLTEVPVEENIPAVFVIIDEFAQMSQILKETKGEGHGSDYTIKLENLLAKGRALGFKFIFASQTYTTGISGLTETACKQIQMRFALKNTPDEIKQTLTLSSAEINDSLNRAISSLPAYETLFKWRDDGGEVHVGQFENMYTENGEIEYLVDGLNKTLKPKTAGSRTDNKSYIEKNPVLIDGGHPKTFRSQIAFYKAYEQTANVADLDEDDVLIYPGVPCSFNLARPFVLYNGASENVLIAGGERDNLVNVSLSVIGSFSRISKNVTIWAHGRSSAIKRYKKTVFSKRKQLLDLGEICESIRDFKTQVQNRRIENALVVCFGLEQIFGELEIMGDEALPTPTEPIKHDATVPDMSEILDRVRATDDPEEKKRIIADYNALVASQQSPEGQAEEQSAPSVYDARSDVEWLLKRGPLYGIHFVLCFEQAKDFLNLRLDNSLFRHKILFPLSREDSLNLMSARKANEIEDGTFVYTNGKDAHTMRPHIYKGVPCNGWIIEKDGSIVQRGAE